MTNGCKSCDAKETLNEAFDAWLGDYTEGIAMEGPFTRDDMREAWFIGNAHNPPHDPVEHRVEEYPSPELVEQTKGDVLEFAAQLCEIKVDRPAGYNGAWEGYGGFKGDMTGPECAALIRSRITRPVEQSNVEQPVGARPSRAPADYAIEHAGYMAEAAKRFMQSVAAVSEARQRHEDAEPGNEAGAAFDVLNGQEELLSERWSDLRSMVYEFEKRRDRALAAPPKIQDRDAARLDAIEKWGGAYIINWGADGATGNPWTVDRCCDLEEQERAGTEISWEGATMREAIDAAIAAGVTPKTKGAPSMRAQRYYVLDGHTPKPVDDVLEWGKFFEDTEARRVAHDMVGDVSVSTVFLGLDHSFGRKGPPILFETMVFKGPLDGEQERYSTWDEAVAGHAAMIERVKAASVSGEHLQGEKP